MPCAMPLLSGPVLRRTFTSGGEADVVVPPARRLAAGIVSVAARLPALVRRPPPPLVTRRMCWGFLPQTLVREDNLFAAEQACAPPSTAKPGFPRISREDWPAFRVALLGKRRSRAGILKKPTGAALSQQAIALWSSCSAPRQLESFKRNDDAKDDPDENATVQRSYDGTSDLEFERVTKLRNGDALYSTMVSLRVPELERHRARLLLSEDMSKGARASLKETDGGRRDNLRHKGLEEVASVYEGDTTALLDIGNVPVLGELDMEVDDVGGLHGFLGLQDGTEQPTALVQPSSAFPEPHMKKPRVSSVPTCITAPTSVPVAKADVDLAQHCLDTRRCFLLMPPPLCALAPILLIANSYLQEDYRDHRVLILCLGLEKAGIVAVSDYAKSFLVETGTSFERAEGQHGDKILESAGVVLASGLNGLDARELSSFSFVSIIVSSKANSNAGCLAKDQLSKMKGFARDTKLMTTIFAFYPECVDLPAMAPWFEVARDVFDVKRVVLQSPLTSDESVRSRTGFLSNEFVILPKAPQEALEVFESAAFPLLRTLTSGREEELPLTLLSTEISELHSLLETCRKDLTSKYARERMQSLVLLNTQKRGLTFCLDDSIQRGLEFLTEAASRYPHDLLRKCVTGLSDIQKRGDAQNTALILHRVARVRSLIETEKESMRGECQATQALRMQKTFTALIIADSSCAVDHLLRSIDNAVDVDKLEPLLTAKTTSAPFKTPVCIAHCEQLDSTTATNSAALKFFSKFSHVFYLASVSGTANPPTPVLQLSHAGRLRFIGVHVDVLGNRAAKAQTERNMFTKLCLEVSKLGEKHGDITSVQNILETFNNAKGGGKDATDHQKVARGQQLDIGIGVLARQDCNWIAGFLFAKLSALASSHQPLNTGKPKLEVRVHVPPAATTHIASMRLMEAICSYRHLLDNVTVVYVAESNADTGNKVDGEVFRPRKRVRSS